MRLSKILLTQTIRLMSATPEQESAPPPETRPRVHIVDFVQKLEHRYKFLQAPRTVPEYDFGAGIKFFKGTFNERSFIERLEIYNNGILCETTTSTEEMDQFLDNLMTWAIDEFGWQSPTGARWYVSNVEVHADINIAEKFREFADIGQRITEILHTYGQQPPAFSVAQIGLHGDVTKVPFPAPRPFLFERRAAVPYSAGFYFSSAPLTTAHHLEILQKLEMALNR
jgi:hypothetical protein